MGKISFRSDDDNVQRIVERTMEKTVIHQRQRELAPGHWDFVVFGPSVVGSSIVVRVGVAEQMMVQNASVYIASVGSPDIIGHGGMMPIEELAGEDISSELRGLEVYHVAPLRPLNILSKRTEENLEKTREMVIEEFGEQNIAIIETPDEAAWSIAVLKYLNECDELFSDPLMSSIRTRMRDTSISFGPRPGRIN